MSFLFRPGIFIVPSLSDAHQWQPLSIKQERTMSHPPGRLLSSMCVIICTPLLSQGWGRQKKKITWLRQIKWTLTSFVVSDILWQMHIGDINMQAAARPGGRFRLTSTEYKDEKVCKWVVNRRWTEKTRESEPVSPMLFWMGATIRLLRKTRGRRMNCFLIVASRKSTEGIDRYSIKSKYQIRYSPLSPWSKVVNNTLIFLWSWTCTDLQYIE